MSWRRRLHLRSRIECGGSSVVGLPVRKMLQLAMRVRAQGRRRQEGPYAVTEWANGNQGEGGKRSHTSEHATQVEPTRTRRRDSLDSPMPQAMNAAARPPVMTIQRYSFQSPTIAGGGMVGVDCCKGWRRDAVAIGLQTRWNAICGAGAGFIVRR